ncbi:MAG: hypothetical protein ACR2RE_15095 [Geminicoccaceae bacterium]
MEWQWFTAVIAVPVVAGLIGWTMKLQGRIAATEKELNAFMVKTAETYVTKDDMQQLEQRLVERLKNLDQKLDRIINGRCAPTSQ